MFQKLNSNIFLLIIYVSIVLIIGHFIGILIWSEINLSFTNPNNIVGKLTLYSYNPLNNILRFISYISISSIIVLIIHLLSKKEDSLIINEIKGSNTLLMIHKLVLILFIFAVFLNFFTKELTTEYFDSFHEGVELSPAYNYLIKDGLWSETLFVRGVFNDVLTAYWGWKIFGIETIGAYRIMVEIFKTLIPLSFILLVYSIGKKINNVFFGIFISQILIFMYFITSSIQYFERRAVPLLIGVSLLLFAKKYNSRIYFFATGLMGSIGIFYSVDIGLFLIALFLLYPVILFFLKNLIISDFLKKDLFLYIGLFLGYLIFIFSLSSKEQIGFLSNISFLINYKDLLDSQIYPIPNFRENFRATIPLVVTSFNLVIALYFYLKLYSKKMFFNQAFIHITLTFVSIIFYRGALGRADLTHIEYSSTLIYLVFGLNIAIILMYYVKNQYILKTLLYFFILLNLIFISYKYFKDTNIKNLLNFNSRVDYYINLPDKSFYNQNYIVGINEITELIKNENCIVSLTSDAIAPFMFKKPSCNEFYISYFASGNPLREKFILSLEIAKPKYIIYSSSSWTQNLDNISNEQRFPSVMMYINENYQFYKNYSNYWNVYIRK